MENAQSISGTLSSSKLFRLTALVLLYLTPPTLLLFDLIPFEFRFVLLIGIAAFLSFYSYYQGFTFKDLGFRRDTLASSLKWNLLLSICSILFVWGLVSAGIIRTVSLPEWSYFFVFYILISGPFQEFIFRAALYAEMQRHWKGKLPYIICSSLIFSYLHIFYKDPFTLLLTLIMGFIWGTIYAKYPNFIGVAISHAIVGAIVISMGAI